MKAVLLRSALVLLLVAAGGLLLGPLLSGCDAPGGVDSPATKADDAFTQQRLDDWLGGGGLGVVVLTWGLKLALAVLGVVFLVREIQRADRLAHAPAADPRPRGALAVASPGQALGLAILFPLGVQILLVALFPPDRPRPVGPLEFGVVVAVASFLPPALITVLRRLRLGAGTLPTVGEGVRAGLAFACIATLVVLPIQLGWVLTLHARGEPLVVQDVIQKFMQPEQGYQPWLLGFFGVFIAPFTEEAVFRGLLYPALRARMPGGPFAAAVVVSLLFAAIHGSLLAFVPLFVLAMVLTWVMERTNSLLACVIVHAIHNAASVLPLLVRHAQSA